MNTNFKTARVNRLYFHCYIHKFYLEEDEINLYANRRYKKDINYPPPFPWPKIYEEK